MEPPKFSLSFPPSPTALVCVAFNLGQSHLSPCPSFIDVLPRTIGPPPTLLDAFYVTLRTICSVVLLREGIWKYLDHAADLLGLEMLGRGLRASERS